MNWHDAFVFTPPVDGEYLVQIGRNYRTAVYENKVWKLHGGGEIVPDLWANVNVIEEEEDEVDCED